MGHHDESQPEHFFIGDQDESHFPDEQDVGDQGGLEGGLRHVELGGRLLPCIPAFPTLGSDMHTQREQQDDTNESRRAMAEIMTGSRTHSDLEKHGNTPTPLGATSDRKDSETNETADSKDPSPLGSTIPEWIQQMVSSVVAQQFSFLNQPEIKEFHEL